jgi:hypothetical protein
MRCSYLGERFSCLGCGLLAVLLSAPISMNAQSGSSLQSQEAQSASPPPASQSQTQSTPACSDAPPIMKRGKQADLPPCPDPPAVAPSSTNSAPTRPPAPPQSLIEKARDAAFEFSQNLPNFICQEFMARFARRGRDETPLDVVSAEIIYTDGHESYRNVKIDNHPTQKSLEEIGGAWSTGEFASTLLSLFSTNTDARFQSGGASTIAGQSAEVYDFQVRTENSHWQVQVGSQTLTPAYEGSIWIDPKTARALRIEIQARSIPSDFPLSSIESAVDYSDVTINGASFLLPVHAENVGCQRGTNQCDHNVIDFRNYHEFKVDVKIVPHLSESSDNRTNSLQILILKACVYRGPQKPQHSFKSL